MWCAGINDHFVCYSCLIQSFVKLAHLFLRDNWIIASKEAECRVLNVPGFFKQGCIGACRFPAHSSVEANYSGEVKVLICACSKRKSPSHAKAKCEGRTSRTLTRTQVI